MCPEDTFLCNFARLASAVHEISGRFDIPVREKRVFFPDSGIGGKKWYAICICRLRKGMVSA